METETGKRSRASPPLTSPDINAGSDSNFVSTFHQQCLQTLQLIWDCQRNRPMGRSNRRLRESIARLMLWGSGWKDGQLDDCLKCSPRLRETLTELLSGLAKVLIRRMHPWNFCVLQFPNPYCSGE